MTDEIENCQPKDSDKFENCQPKPVRCGCGGEAVVKMWAEPDTPFLVMCEKCKASSGDYSSESEAIEAWNRAMGATDTNVGGKFAKDINVPDKERTAKVTHKPEAFFYRCECGYGLCCEKNDMNYCPSCGARLEWDE